MSERLRLEAEFRDKGVSSGLKKIGTELAVIKKTPGMTEAHKWLGEFNERADGFVRDGGGIKGVMTGIGIGGLTAAASLNELVKSFSELANRTADLKEVSRQTGLTVDEVNRLQRAGEQLYIDPSKMTAGLEHLSSQMFDFRRHMGELYGELSQFDPDFARKLSFDTPEQQVKDIVEWLSKIPAQMQQNGRSAADAAELQKRWTEAFLGNGELSRLLTHDGRDFAQAMKDAADNAARITPEMEAKADLLHKAIIDFNHEWTDFETSVAPAVFDQLRAAMQDFKGVFEDLKGIYDWFQKAKADPAGAAKGVLDQADKAFDTKAKEVGDRWRERIKILKDGRDSARGEDGNALHRNDEAPLDRSARGKVQGDSDKIAPAAKAPLLDGAALMNLERERSALQAKINADRTENPVGAEYREARDIARLGDISAAIANLTEAAATGSNAVPKASPEPSAKKISFDGGDVRVLLHQASFGGDAQRDPRSEAPGDIRDLFRTVDNRDSNPPAAFGSPADAIAVGTKQGVLAAFRELMQQNDLRRDGKPRTGLQNAAFETSDDDGPGRRNGYGLKGLGSERGETHGETDAGPIAAGPSNEQGRQNVASWLDFFKRSADKGGMGLPADKARAMVAMIQGESGPNLDPGSFNPNDNGGPSGGTAQWHNERFAALKAFAQARHKAWQDRETQQAFWKHEAETSERGAMDAVRAAPDAASALREGVQRFERPKDPRGETRKRMGNLRRLEQDDAGPGEAGKAVDSASKLIGMGSREVAQRLGARMTPGEWCADFVNGALKSANIKGTNSSIANDFLSWGKEVAAETVRKGDVLVENRGRGAGSTGGHVGLATGETRMRNGHLEEEMISGNHGGQVGRSWEDSRRLHTRRQLNLPEVARKSGADEQTVKHEGGASLDISLRHDGSVRSTKSQARGLITAVNLSRGPTMMLPHTTA